jgi:hypothetical protein
MKRFFRNIAILIFPFLLMIIINEIVRPAIKGKPYSKYRITAMNSDDKISHKCTWICHNNTGFCKESHVKHLKPYYKYTDTIYFGMISLLQKTGNYGLANIIFFVILVPFFIWFFIVKSLNIQDEINLFKKPNNE